jgi:hypothetical protein
LDPDEEGPLRTPATSVGQDAALQVSLGEAASSSLTTLSTNPGRNILGLGTGFANFNAQATVPPDPNGAAGASQFVEFVNDSFAVFDKTTGNPISGPTLGNTLWQPLGAPCATNPNLDEVAQYDKLANRWVMMMPDFYNPNYHVFRCLHHFGRGH